MAPMTTYDLPERAVRTLEASIKIVKDRNKIIPIFDNAVQRVDTIVAYTYSMIKSYILWHIHHKSEPPKITLQFITNCMQVVTGGDKYETALSDFYAELKFPIVSGHRISYVLAIEAEKILKSFEDNINRNFVKLTDQYLYTKYIKRDHDTSTHTEKIELKKKHKGIMEVFYNRSIESDYDNIKSDQKMIIVDEYTIPDNDQLETKYTDTDDDDALIEERSYEYPKIALIMNIQLL